jgi:starch-binding outer membrane protein, SusD/RagB family
MKNLLVVLGFTSLFFGCKKEVLDLDPISEIGSNEFYSTPEEVELATIAIYDGLQNVPLREFAITEMRSDNTRTKASEGDWAQFESFSITPTNQQVAIYWTVNYNVIFRANRVIENLDVVPSGSFRDQLEGEAKFSRALAHFNLVRAYGDIPIIDKVIGITESEFFERDPVDLVLDFITADLQDAAELLPPKGALEFGRATSGAAKGLLAKVFLNRANYSQAEMLLSSILSSGEYSLEDDYRDVFYNEGNDEILFAIPYLNDDINESQDFSFEMTAGGVRSGLNYLTNDFLARMNPQDSVRNGVLQNPVNFLEVGKYLSSSANARLCGNDWIVLRLADIYLLYVEAKMAGQLKTQNLDAIAAFNAVRQRVRLSTLATDGSAEITLDMLLNERRFELAFENHRLHDLIRTGQALSVLGNFAATEGYNFTSTDLLLPIPQREMNVSGGRLVQNPGYN